MNTAFLSLFFSIVSFACISQPFTASDSLRGTLSPERACFDVRFYDLSLAIVPEQHFIKGQNTIYFSAEKDFSSFQLDLHQDLTLHSVTDAEDSMLTSVRKGNSLFVRFRTLQKKGTQSFIRVSYSGEPHRAINPPWDGGFVWALDSLDRPWVSVACEGVGASLWWPCKDHPSDEPDSMRMRFEVPETLFCASNGNLRNTSPTANHTVVYEWFVQYPINTYNATLNIGAYLHLSDTYTRKDQSALALDYYVLSYNKENAKKHFEQVKPILNCYETIFGKYPFEKDGYALIESPYWGMEHQSAIAYGNRFKNNMSGLDYIIVHESGHEWWGNYLSAADHADLWIHEAFTTYGETLLLECLASKEAAKKHLEAQKKLIKNKEAIQGPYGVNYHYWQDSDMYYKGAWMLHTLRNSLPDDSLWFAVLKSIQKKFGGTQFNSSQLIAHINEFTGYDYTGFFNQYLTQINLPVFEYALSRKDKQHHTLSYRWVSEVKDFALPLVLKRNQAASLTLSPKTTFQTILLPSQEIKAVLETIASDFYIQTREIPPGNLKKNSR